MAREVAREGERKVGRIGAMLVKVQCYARRAGMRIEQVSGEGGGERGGEDRGDVGEGAVLCPQSRHEDRAG